MKIRMSRMFQDGVETDKKTFFARFDYKCTGVLVVASSTEQGQHRDMKMASFYTTLTSVPQPSDVLYEPDIEWANDGKFVLTGFERKKVNGEIVRYAQSWLCRIGWEEPPQPVSDDKGPLRKVCLR